MLSLLLRAGLTFITIGMLNAFGLVGTAEAAHCSTLFKMSAPTDSLGTTSNPTPTHSNDPVPATPIPQLQIPLDVEPGTGSCGTDTGPVRGSGSVGQTLVVMARLEWFTPELGGRIPIPTDWVRTNMSTAAIFEPPRLCS